MCDKNIAVRGTAACTLGVGGYRRLCSRGIRVYARGVPPLVLRENLIVDVVVLTEKIELHFRARTFSYALNFFLRRRASIAIQRARFTVIGRPQRLVATVVVWANSELVQMVHELFYRADCYMSVTEPHDYITSLPWLSPAQKLQMPCL